MQQLCISYGPTPLIKWLKRLNGVVDGAQASKSKASVPVYLVLLCFGELAIEAGLLNSALSRTGGDSEVGEKEMFCHFSLMIQLMAIAYDRRDVITGSRELLLPELMMLAEEEWLKSVPAIGIRSILNTVQHHLTLRLYKLISLCRHKFMHQVFKTIFLFDWVCSRDKMAITQLWIISKCSAIHHLLFQDFPKISATKILRNS